MASKNVKFEKSNSTTTEESDSDSGEELTRRFNKFQFLELVDNPEHTSDLEGDEQLAASDDKESESENVEANQATKSDVPLTRSKNRKRRHKNKHKTIPIKPNQDQLNNDELLLLKNHQHNENESEKSYTSSDRSHLDLLKLNLKYLIPDNELKRMFGKEVLKEERSDEQRGKKHFLAGPSRNIRSRFVSSLNQEAKSSYLLDIGPKMDLDELFNPRQPEDNNNKKKQFGSAIINSNQPIYFKFVHDKTYQEAHKVFLNAVQRGYSEEMYNNLRINPNHVESLIQLSDIIRLQEEYKTAADFVEKALILFERGFHQKFNLMSGNCRLSYRRPENRSFFITLFKHINYLDRRGMRRTPLEYTKLLLSLDPDNDPLFATLLIDFYALRGEEYDYLIDFIGKWQHLSKLPNMSFSLALAYFMKYTKSANKRNNKLNLELADKNLQRALLRYPNFVIPLLDACSGEPSAELSKADYFNYTVYTNKYKLVPESIELLISLYVQRNLMFWKSKDILSWLERNVSVLVSKFASGEVVDCGQNLECWSNFRGPLPRNLLRHAVLSDFKVKLPQSATRSSYLDIDPYPPIDSVPSYSIEMNSNAENLPGSDTYSGALGFSSLFLRSILPGFTLNGNQDRNAPSGSS